MRFNVDDGAWGTWVKYATSASAPSLGADGLHKVGVEYLDKVGNTSAPYYYSTNLDSVGPSWCGRVAHLHEEPIVPG